MCCIKRYIKHVRVQAKLLFTISRFYFYFPHFFTSLLPNKVSGWQSEWQWMSSDSRTSLVTIQCVFPFTGEEMPSKNGSAWYIIAGFFLPSKNIYCHSDC